MTNGLRSQISELITGGKRQFEDNIYWTQINTDQLGHGDRQTT